MTIEPPNLMTAAEVARRLNAYPLTLRRKIRGHVSPVAYLLQARREPSPLYDQEGLSAARRLLQLSAQPPTTI